ncbi:MAG TPA: clostripain-related cysteine peptidase [Candidatus Obscuribacterales bacterium]
MDRGLQTTGDANTLSKRRGEQEWTVAIDLKLTLDDKLGAKQKSDALQKLQAESHGKPVSLVVQVSDKQKTDGAVSRYLIKDGQLTPLSQPHTKDPSGLIGELVRYAGSSQPSKRLGLVVFSHGFGVHGLGTNLGPVSLDSLAQDMHSALSKLHRQKVDLLAFDGCSMAQADTLAKVSPIAKHVVASAEFMPCASTDTCGLNEPSWMSKLLQHPHMSAGQLADSAVETERREFDRVGGGEAVTTLAHFDLQHYPKFAHALDRFANELSSSLKVPGNKQAMLKLVQTTPEYERFYFLDLPYPAPKDLDSFATQIANAIKDGSIADRSGKLAMSAHALLQAEKAITPLYFGGHQNTAQDQFGVPKSLHVRARVPYDRLGGLSISLPDDDQLADAKKEKETPQQLIAKETTIPSWKHFLDRLHK